MGSMGNPASSPDTRKDLLLSNVHKEIPSLSCSHKRCDLVGGSWSPICSFGRSSLSGPTRDSVLPQACLDSRDDSIAFCSDM